MKDYSKCNIELRYEWVFIGAHDDNDPRYIYWRVQPSEMTWWDRHFHNPWRQFSRVITDDLNDIYSPRSFKNELSHIKTVEQARNYQDEQYKILNEIYQKKVDKGEAWPIDL